MPIITEEGALIFSRKDVSLLVFSATLMLVLNIFVFIPFGIYQGNLAEFEVGFLQMLQGYWQIAALTWLVLLSPLLFVGRVVRVYAVIVFVLACFTWLQSTFLMWDYGVFDGRGMNFEPFRLLGSLDLLVLFALVLGACLYTSRIAPLVNTIAVLFIVGQLGLMFSSAMGRDRVWVRELPLLEIPEEILSISSSQNIFHIILDSAQSDAFLQLVDETDLRDEFSGFTLFLDNAAVAPHTAFGVPSTFSGKLFDGSHSPEVFFSEAMQDGFHTDLLGAGYSVNLVPVLSMEKGPYTNHYQIPSGYRGTNVDLVWANAAKLMDTSLFRFSPHFLRIQVYNGGNWLLSNMDKSEGGVRTFRDRKFFSDYIDGLTIRQDEPGYHFVHLMPPHPPYVTLADGSYAKKVLPNVREHYIDQMRPMVDLLVRFIERLKTLGVYDDAAIIVQGDHGSSVTGLVDGVVIQTCVPRLPALLTVKPPLQSEPLLVSNAETSMLDIAPTVLILAGQEASGVFDLDPSESRSRHYFAYRDNRISKYRIEGSVFDAGSCKKAGFQDVEVIREEYQMGSLIKFGMQGNASAITDYGWGPQLNGQAWSKTNEAALKMLIPEQYLNTDLDLELQYLPYIHEEKQPRQRVSASVNGTLVSEWVETIRKTRKRVIRIPASAVDDRELSIVFEFPDAVSPRSLGLGADGKRLGIGLRAVRLSEREDE